MDNLKPFIHLFRTLNKNYVFDVNTSAILTVDKEVYLYLENLLSGSSASGNKVLTDQERQKAIAWVKHAQEQGFLSPKRVQRIQHYYDKYLEGLTDQYMGNLILQITQACNLRCNYCAYSGDYLNRPHGELSMSEETAKKAVDFFVEHSSEMPHLAFGFYGGEPFLNFDLIKKMVSYIKQRVRGKEFELFITSNGTLINDEIIHFLIDNKVNLLISLDGPKEVHDRNRCFGSGRGSFDVVIKNIEKIQKTAPEYVKDKVKFNAVFTDDVEFCSLTRFFTDFETIKDPFVIASNPNPYYMTEEKKEEEKSVNYQYYDDLNYETYKNMLYRSKRLERTDVPMIVLGWEERERADMEDRRMSGVQLPSNFHPGGPCVPGSRRLFVTIHGELFPCERLSETSKVGSLGNLDTGIDIEKARKILNIGRITEEACKNCWAMRFCLACVACSDNGKEMDKKLKLSYCKNFIADAQAKLTKYCTYKEFNISTEKNFQ
jgi:uncharacterized protein